MFCSSKSKWIWPKNVSKNHQNHEKKATCECWEAHSNFELDIIASYMHSKLCGHPVSKKELAKSNFKLLKKNTQICSIDF